MGGRMFRAVVLLVGLVLCLAAAAVVLSPSGTPSAQATLVPVSAAPLPVQTQAATVDAAAAGAGENTELAIGDADPGAVNGTQTGDDSGTNALARSGSTLIMQASMSAARVAWWPRQTALFAGLLAAGGVVCLGFWTLASRLRRGAPVDPRSPATVPAVPLVPHMARRAEAAQAAPAAPAREPTAAPAALDRDPAAVPATADHARAQAEAQAVKGKPERPGGDRTMATRPAVDWLRSDVGDNRAAAAVCAVDQALAAGGWRSRAAGAVTRPDSGLGDVHVDLALHPSERGIAAALAERLRAMHPAWQATPGAGRITVELRGPAPAQALLLPALQLDTNGPWTQYLYAPAALGLAIMGAGARAVLRGMLADLLCMYPPSSLGLTAFGSADAGLYRAAPQWIEPPDMTPETLQRLTAALGAQPSSAVPRPLLLVAAEPQDELLSGLLQLVECAGTLRSPPVTLLVAAERPGAQFRALAAALPSLNVRDASAATAELGFAERRVGGQPPAYGENDLRELLRWLPRFGASPPPRIWDTIV